MIKKKMNSGQNQQMQGVVFLKRGEFQNELFTQMFT